MAMKHESVSAVSPTTALGDDAYQTLPTANVAEIVQFCKLMADETRVHILHYLHQCDELNVLELCRLLRQRQPSVSHHLALLRVAGLIGMRRSGKNNFYRLERKQFERFVAKAFGVEADATFRVCFENYELRYSPLS